MSKPPENFGICYVVATPLGNLGDMSQRAVDTLKKVDSILAEDTRTFGKLAKHFGIPTPSKSYHEHNERERSAWAVAELQQGRSLALVSDAGTPTISDPGFRLIAACRERGLVVQTVPGPNAAIAALSISGLPSDRFSFEGFLPVKKGKRETALKEALSRDCPSIFYESPFRIVKTLQQLSELEPEHDTFLCRELTKLHEEAWRGAAKEILLALSSKPSIKGEFVLILRGVSRRLQRQAEKREKKNKYAE